MSIQKISAYGKDNPCGNIQFPLACSIYNKTNNRSNLKKKSEKTSRVSLENKENNRREQDFDRESTPLTYCAINSAVGKVSACTLFSPYRMSR